MKRFKEMRFVLIYPAASLLETFSSPIIQSESPRLRALGLPDMSANIFLLIEFLIIYHFFLQVFEKNKIKKLLYIIMMIYVSSVALYWILNKSFNQYPDFLLVPQAVCILIPTFYYFLQLLKNPSKVDLKHEPAFWTTTGVLLYFGSTLPLFLLNGIINFTINFERNIFGINFLCYAILFILITKAYLCKKKEAL